METGYARITVQFEAPFWICLYERWNGGSYEACKIPFGAEPGDGQVYERLLSGWRTLAFSPGIPSAGPSERRVNPKRARREARRCVEPDRLGTKAQQALSLQREAGKEARKRRSRTEREAEEARRHALREAKRKEKHKGH